MSTDSAPAKHVSRHTWEVREKLSRGSGLFPYSHHHQPFLPDILVHVLFSGRQRAPSSIWFPTLKWWPERRLPLPSLEALLAEDNGLFDGSGEVWRGQDRVHPFYNKHVHSVQILRFYQTQVTSAPEICSEITLLSPGCWPTILPADFHPWVTPNSQQRTDCRPCTYIVTDIFFCANKFHVLFSGYIFDAPHLTYISPFQAWSRDLTGLCTNAFLSCFSSIRETGWLWLGAYIFISSQICYTDSAWAGFHTRMMICLADPVYHLSCLCQFSSIHPAMSPHSSTVPIPWSNSACITPTPWSYSACIKAPTSCPFLKVQLLRKTFQQKKNHDHPNYSCHLLHCKYFSYISWCANLHFQKDLLCKICWNLFLPYLPRFLANFLFREGLNNLTLNQGDSNKGLLQATLQTLDKGLDLKIEPPYNILPLCLPGSSCSFLGLAFLSRHPHRTSPGHLSWQPRPRSTSSLWILAIHCSHSAGVAWKEPWLCYNCFVAPTSKCLACCEPLPMHPFAASSLSHTAFTSEMLPQPRHFWSFSYTASLSQENSSALFSRFLTAFKGLLIPVCFKNTALSPLQLFCHSCFRSILVGPIKHPSRSSAHLKLSGASAVLRAGRSHTPSGCVLTGPSHC